MILLLPAGFAAAPVSGTLVAPPPPPPKDPGGQGEDFGKSSPVGLVIMLLFFVAVVLLARSMNKHLRRVPESFDNQPLGGADRTSGGEDGKGEEAGPGRE